MEPQYQQQQEDGSCGGSSLANKAAAAAGGGGGGGGGGFLCRQSSTRWIPTSDQIRILRDLYYNNGLRSPNAEQIQRISARLRQYGKIEGKNVFYWFQNHKARERQKKRLTVDITAAPTTTNSGGSSCCKSTSTVISPGFPTGGRSSGLYNVGHGGNDGSLLAETSFREYCMAGGSMSGVGWGGADSTTSSAPWAHHYCPSAANAMSREIETLQLFPINAKEEHQAAAAEYYSPSPHFVAKDGRSSSSSKNIYPIPSFYYEEQPPHNHHHHHLYSVNGGGNVAAETCDHQASDSLELTLNSYYYAPSDST